MALLVNGEVPEYIYKSNGDAAWTLNVNDNGAKERIWTKTVYLSSTAFSNISNVNKLAFNSAPKMWNNVTNEMSFIEIQDTNEPFLGMNPSYEYFVSGISSNSEICSVPGYTVLRYNCADLFSRFSNHVFTTKIDKCWYHHGWHDNNHANCFRQMNCTHNESKLILDNTNLGDCQNMFRDGVFNCSEVTLSDCTITNASNMFVSCRIRKLNANSNILFIGDASNCFRSFNATNHLGSGWGDVIGSIPKIKGFCESLIGGTFVPSIPTNLSNVFAYSNFIAYTDYDDEGFNLYFNKPANCDNACIDAKFDMGRTITIGVDPGGYTGCTYRNTFRNAQIGSPCMLLGNFKGDCSNIFYNANFYNDVSGTSTELRFVPTNYSGGGTSMYYAFSNSNGIRMGSIRMPLNDGYAVNNAVGMFYKANMYDQHITVGGDGNIYVNNGVKAFTTPRLFTLTNDIPRGADGSLFEGSIIYANDALSMFYHASNYTPCTDNQGNYIANCVWLSSARLTNVIGMFNGCPSFFKHITNLHIKLPVSGSNASRVFANFINNLFSVYVSTSGVFGTGSWCNFVLPVFNVNWTNEWDDDAEDYIDVPERYVAFNCNVAGNGRIDLRCNNSYYCNNHIIWFDNSFNGCYTNGVNAHEGHTVLYAQLVMQNYNFI